MSLRVVIPNSSLLVAAATIDARIHLHETASINKQETTALIIPNSSPSVTQQKRKNVLDATEWLSLPIADPIAHVPGGQAGAP